jgi:glutamine amidotransferase
MGWNSVSYAYAHPLLAGLPPDEAFYFVHSYYAAPARAEDICGRTEYGGLTFTSIAARGSLFATQFHPERSGEAGLVLLRNFLSWDGRSIC